MTKKTVVKEDDIDVTRVLVNGQVRNNDGKPSSFKRFQTRLKEDSVFRRKFIIFVVMCYTFLCLGMNICQFGPTLLDLQQITKCTLDQASFFFNAHTLGYLMSSLAVGLLFERFNKLLLMGVPIVMASIVTATIPWSSVYEVMVTIHFLKGFFLGMMDAVGNALFLHLLMDDVRTYMQILHFMFAFGGIISPLMSAPFLSQKNTFNATATVLENNIMSNNTENTFNLTADMQTSQSSIVNTQEVSEVYKAYLICALLTFTSAIPFFLLYFRTDDSTCPTSTSQAEQPPEKLSIKLRVFALVVLCMIIASYTAMEDTYAGFLSTFVVKRFKWEKSDGAYATSVFWASFSIGRFCGIFIVNFIGQVKLMCIYSLTIIAAFVCLLATSLSDISEGVWITSAVLGFGMSIFFPIFFSWTEEKFFHVDGKITSLIMACACIGVIINPIILARVMDSAPIWFGYILVGQSVLLFVLFSIAVYISRLIKKVRLQSCHNETEITVEPCESLTTESKH